MAQARRFLALENTHYDAFMCPMLICERRVMTTNVYSRDGREQKNAVVEDADRGKDKKTA